MMRIVAICGAGIGTSAILQVNAQRVLARLDIEADVSATDAASLASVASEAQIVLTTAEFAAAARATGWAEVIVIDSVTDLAELQAKLAAALQ